MKFPSFPGMVKHRSASEIGYFVGTMQAAALKPEYVATIIEFETARTWNPASKGPKAFTDPPGYAAGLIGFAPRTARELGTTVEQLERMSFLQQLPYVVKYFEQHDKRRLKRLVDYYAAVFWPNAIGTADDYVIASSGSPVYDANKGLDHGGKGSITTGDLNASMQAYLAGARQAGEIEVTPRTLPGRAAAVVLVGLGAAAAVTLALVLRRRRLL